MPSMGLKMTVGQNHQGCSNNKQASLLDVATVANAKIHQRVANHFSHNFQNNSFCYGKNNENKTFSKVVKWHAFVLSR